MFVPGEVPAAILNCSFYLHFVNIPENCGNPVRAVLSSPTCNFLLKPSIPAVVGTSGCVLTTSVFVF